jgi:AsmA protein
VDPNDYRAYISELVREQTGRDFGIDGDLSLSIFPWVGVTAHDMWLAQPDGLEGGNMIDVGEVDLRVKLRPLIDRKIEIGSIVLLDPTIRIILTEDGRSSFDGLGESNASGEAGADAGDAAGAAAAIAVQGLELENGSFVWEDKAAGQRYELRELSIETGQLLTGTPGPLSASGQLMTSTSPDSIQFEFDALVSIDVEDYSVGMTDIETTITRGGTSVASLVETLRFAQATSQLNLHGLTATLDLEDQPVEIAIADLGLNLEQQTLDMPAFRVTMPPSVLSGAVTGSQVFDDPVIAGNLAWEDQETGQRYEITALNLALGQVPAGEADRVSASGVLVDGTSPDPLRFDMTGLVAIDSEASEISVSNGAASFERGEMNISAQVETLRFRQATRQFNLSGLELISPLKQRPVKIIVDTLAANLETQELEIPHLEIDISPALFTASISGTQIIDNPGITGQLKADTFNLAELLKNSGYEYIPADPDAMSAISLSITYSATSSSVGLSGLVRLDESALAGSINVDNFDAPLIGFDLSLNAIDIDRYVPATIDEDAASRQRLKAGAALVLPVALFRELNANGSFNADSLVSGGMRVRNIDIQVVSDEESVTVTPTADLYGGTVEGTLTYRNLGGREELVIRENIDNVRLGDLLADTGVTDRVSGTGGLNIDITVAEEGGIQSSDGLIRFLARDGELKGVDFQKLLQQATWVYNQVRGREPDPDGASPGEGTRFTELTGTFTIKNMVMTNDDLVMKAPGFRVNGKGTIDLNRQELDYLASAAIVKSAEGQGGAERTDLRGIPVPVRCSGNISDPSCGLDMGELTRAIAKQEINRKRGEIEEKIAEKLGEELNLEGLFDLLNK